MNKKIFWGAVLIIIGLFYTLQQYIPESILRYFFNYQIIILIIGLWNIFQKKRTFGITLTVVSIYLYLKEFFYDYFEIMLPIVILLGGVIVLLLGVIERNSKIKAEKEKNAFIFKSIKKEKNKVEDAEEIK